MNTEELTQIANVHQSILTRHDQEITSTHALIDRMASQHRDDFSAINQILDRVGTKLDQIAQQQEANTQAIALNQEAIAQLTAGIGEVRNQLADYMSSRSPL